MPAESRNADEARVTEAAWRRMLLDGELSPAEYAARVVAPPSLRFVSPRYQRRLRSSAAPPLMRVRVLLLLALISGTGALIAVHLALPRAVVLTTALISTVGLVLTALFVATSGTAQENWLLNHEVRHRRRQVDAYAAYGDTLLRSLKSLARGAEIGGVTADFIRDYMNSLRAAMAGNGHEDVILVILRRDVERYLVVYLALPTGSPYESKIKLGGADAGEFFTRLGQDVFSQVVAFELAETEHELVAVSADPFGPPEQWALQQMAAYCSAVGALARL
jgi:hypothetical protein